MFLYILQKDENYFCLYKDNLKINEEELLGGKMKEMDTGDMTQLTECLLYTKPGFDLTS